MIAVSRMYLGVHYLSDTVAGVVLYDGPDTANDNALFYDDLSGGSETVSAGDEYAINAGDLSVAED